ncbi:PREDICTED: serologically defined colon cancer antigen 3 homolog [Buceros rhinoceros silvestris]|uniref:serologically defined colon cancer antigen 3 homolog n=1 Tax=Buceros rhinoceros silvestris TaxID=175836 RepID=UPI00052931A3|nr:PREDICTED: serologically defined colon cancer antigen 3 homolog [Buceros rhinoceros silvestris]
MSLLLNISRTTERVFSGSQDLEDGDDDNDNDDEFIYPCHSVSQSKTYDSLGDSQVDDVGEPTSFSLNPRHSYVMKDRLKNRIYAQRLAKYTLELEEEARKFQEPVYKDTEMPGSLPEHEYRSWTYHLPMRQRSRVLQTAGMAPYGSYDSFRHSVGKHLGMDAFASWARASDPYTGNPEHTKGAEPQMLHQETIGAREFLSLPMTYDMLREENTMLRRALGIMKSSLKTQACTVQRLERQLKAIQAEEERKTQELQSFVQQMEWSLQLMTQRALEAENNVEKLKQENFILQGELESSKAENKNLRAGQATDLGAVKHNIDFALQNLHKIILGANWSIKQFTSGTQSLCFIAEVLKSTGNISEVEAEKKP